MGKTYHAHVMPLCWGKKDLIIGVGRYLLKQNKGDSAELEECRLKIALFLESVGVSFGLFSHSQPSFERPGSISK